MLPFARNGVNNGLQLFLDAEVYDYASALQSRAGFLFTVLHHLDIAILKQTGSVATPGQSVQVGGPSEIRQKRAKCQLERRRRWPSPPR